MMKVLEWLIKCLRIVVPVKFIKRPRPLVVGMPLSSGFIHTAAMHLIAFDKMWVLHLIYVNKVFTRCNM